jgi:glycerophosphoryl diester phosphodiesterase
VLPSLIEPPIAFAHRGGRAHAPENSLQAFRLALRLGATGVESDVWLTADGVPVLTHDGRVRIGRRSRRVADVAADDVAPSVPRLAELYEACGTGMEVSLDLKDPAAAEPVLAVAADAGALGRLWLCHGDADRLAALRPGIDGARLVCSTRLRAVRGGAERFAARLAATGIDALNLHHTEWTGGLTTLFHRFGVFAFGWDANHTRMVSSLRTMGVDAVYGDHVDRLVEGLGLA